MYFEFMNFYLYSYHPWSFNDLFYMDPDIIL